MLTLFFSGTGNTKYLAELFSHKIKQNVFQLKPIQTLQLRLKNMKRLPFVIRYTVQEFPEL